MGAGGSTAGRSESPLMVAADREVQPSRFPDAATPPEVPHQECTKSASSCCCHQRDSHSSHTRTVTPVTKPRRATIDDEIEEIVANTNDLPTNPQTPDIPYIDSDIDDVIDSRITSSRRAVTVAHGGAQDENPTLPRTVPLENASQRTLRRRQTAEDMVPVENDAPSGVKDPLPEIDFAKFKKVNHKGTAIQRNGKFIHHQESDLLWRLGLISPEAYTLTKTTSHSAPHTQGQYLKTPSYDLTEEQLMANIEKEFTEVTSAT